MGLWNLARKRQVTTQVPKVTAPLQNIVEQFPISLLEKGDCTLVQVNLFGISLEIFWEDQTMAHILTQRLFSTHACGLINWPVFERAHKTVTVSEKPWNKNLTVLVAQPGAALMLS